MDNYIEQIVESKPGGLEYIKVIGSGILTAAGLFVFLLISPGIGLLVFALGIFLVHLSKNASKYEYEYEITNGDFSIDKIINKASRKHMLNFDESDIQRVLTYESAKFQNELDVNSKLVVKDFTSGNEKNKADWYAFIVNSKKDTMAVVIELDGRGREYIENYFKKRIER
jgi:hypothetical protein